MSPDTSPIAESKIKRNFTIVLSIILFLVEIIVLYGMLIMKAWTESDFDYRDHLLFLAGILIACGINYLVLWVGTSKTRAREWVVGEFVTFVVFWVGLTYLFLGRI
jgi:hypothetical protein